MNIFIKILQWKLEKLAQLTLWRFKPGIIGITGSVGKTSTKFAIKAVLEKEYDVRASHGNLNSELGLALTVLGNWGEDELKLVSRETPPHTARARKAFFWLKVILKSFFFAAFGRVSSYPEILILEYGADRPGDIRRLLDVAKPNVGVITAIGEIPVHVEFFAGPEDVAREKARIIDGLPSAGFAVLNCDDDSVMALKSRTRAKIVTFGFGKNADVRISGIENKSEAERPVGVSFKLEHGGAFVPVRLTGVFGKAHAYAAGAAASVGIALGMNLVEISESLKNYRPVGSRMELVPGIKYTYIIDDSYNASPLSMHAALDTVKVLPAKRKIAVLGDMLEIGKYAIEAHEALGRLAGKSVDVLVTVGPRAKFIAESAREGGMSRNRIYSFDIVDEARHPVQDMLKKGDLVLVKASHAIRLDKIVDEIRAF